MSNIVLYRKIIILTALIFVFGVLVPLQLNAQIKEIAIGVQMPNAIIKETINYKITNPKISDFQGKLLILDFWATWCAPCVSMFPTIDTLQQTFGDKVQFLGVTNEPAKKVRDFLNRVSKNKNLELLPSVVNDSLLSKMFYHATIPFYVWIDKTGKVIGTSDRQDITKKNIDEVLAGNKPSFKNRIDNRKKPWALEEPWFVLSNRFILEDSTARREEIAKTDLVSYSAATKWIDDARGYLHYDPDRFVVVNVSIGFLYRFFYNAGYYEEPVRGAFDSDKNHLFQIKNSDILNKITNKNLPLNATEEDQINWGKKNGVCYEIVFPKGLTWKEKMADVKQDLDRYFAKPIGFETHVEKRQDTTFVLRQINPNSKTLTEGGKSEEHHDRYYYSQHNMPLNQFIGLLRSYFFQGKKIIFNDKTGIEVPVDLELNCDMGSIESINKALSKYGLKFENEISFIDVLVFSDKL